MLNARANIGSELSFLLTAFCQCADKIDQLPSLLIRKYFFVRGHWGSPFGKFPENGTI